MAEDIAIIDVIVPPPFVIDVVAGTKGDPGPPGPPGASSSVFFYRIDAMSIGASDPGTGKLRYNATTQADATAFYVDWLTADGFDAHLYFDLVSVGSRLVIQDKDLAVNYQVWEITGPAVNGPDWFAVPVSFVSASGSGVFSHNQNVAVLLMSGEGATLPTAPIWQVLTAQGVGVPPVFRSSVILRNQANDLQWELRADGSDFIIDCQTPAGVTIGNRRIYVSAFNGNLSLGSSISNFEAGDGMHGYFVGLQPAPVSGHNGHKQIGAVVNISDSSTNTPGAVIVGGGSFGVLARWNGTNWIVIGG